MNSKPSATITASLLVFFLSTLFNQNVWANETHLIENERFDVLRNGRHLIVELNQAHRVLSTSNINGGQQSDLKYLVNHQSLEGVGHDDQFTKIISQSDEDAHQKIANTLNINANKMMLMGTAANINHTAHVQKNFKDYIIDAFVTAGVRGNALRAGDTAKWYQGDKGNEFIKSPFIKNKGTINIILLLNRSLTAGAQAKAVSILVEAKSAALAELAISSTVSSHLATGTGTDQYVIASPSKSSLKQLDSASGHLKIGELIGATVREAVLQALILQNGLESSNTRNILHALGRYGLKEELLFKQIKPYLSEKDFELLLKNKKSVFTEPKIVATAYAYAELLDRVKYGTFSNLVIQNILLNQATNTAIATSTKTNKWPIYRQQLKYDNSDVLAPFIKGLAIGWQDKWQEAQ